MSRSLLKSKNPQAYQDMKSKRGQFEDRALHYASLTIPTIMSSQSGEHDVSSQHGWQGVGAQCVNYLANKLAITLFPAQQSFFVLDVNEEGEKLLTEKGYTKTELASTFAKITKRTMKLAEESAFRTALVEAFKHLLITGNVCLRLPQSEDESMQAIPITHYGVRRDRSGNILDFCLMEKKALSTFTPEVQQQIRNAKSPQKLKKDDDITFYTRVEREGDGFYKVTQSADELQVGKVSRVKKDKVPFLPITWRRNYGEDYGRGLVEDQAGDFFIIKFLSEAQARGMALMSDVKFLVRPGSLTDINKFMKARTGDVLFGVEEDIHILQLGKYADFTPIASVLEEYRQRVGQVFMLASLIRRDAERVTAYEIRSDALELEQGLGGAYSLFASTLQTPLAIWYLGLNNSAILSKVALTITTGMSALGQMAELEKLQQLSELLVLPSQWSPQFQQQLDSDKYLKWTLAQLSFDAPFFKDPETVAKEQEEDQNNQLANNAEAEAAKALPSIVQQQAGA